MADADDLVRGLKTAVALAADAAATPGQPVQGGLFPAHALADLPDDPALAAREMKRRRGRPTGALNRSTTEWRKFLEAHYTHPLQFLAETISRSPHDLADELGCTAAEAFAIQGRAAGELAPYLASKMPVAVDVTTNAPMLILGDPTAMAAALAGSSELAGGPLVDVTPIDPRTSPGAGGGNDG